MYKFKLPNGSYGFTNDSFPLVNLFRFFDIRPCSIIIKQVIWHMYVILLAEHVDDKYEMIAIEYVQAPVSCQ